jgi:hypothetical protein
MVTCFTNMSNFLTILAPGALITAAGSTYAGTSQAAPHIAGAVAAIKSAHPSLTVNDVVAKFTSTGTTVINTRLGSTYVKPRLNLEAAMNYPKISITPAYLDFGLLALGDSALKTVTVRNRGTNTLTMGSLTLGGSAPAQFTIQNDGCTSRTLSPNASCTADVRFASTLGGDFSASLVIPSNDPDYSQITVTLSGSTQQKYQLSVSASGNGAVTSQPAGISCGFVCTAQFDKGSQVTLSAVPGADSFFGGWGGACSGIGACQLDMNSAVNVSAVFSLMPVQVGGSTPQYFNLLTSACAAAPDSATIRLQAVSFTECLLLNRPVALTLSGGYDATYGSVSGMTALIGNLTVADGTLTVENLTIQ